MTDNLFNLREIYVNELVQLSEHNSRIVCLDADSKEPLLLSPFAVTFPDRSFSFGISEQDMVTAAGGMATMGLIPFVHSYGIFIVMRALDQLRNSIAYPKLNVKFILSHHGLDAGSDGITHQLTEDIAILRSIPNIKLLQPADRIELTQMIKFAVDENGPIVIKLGKSKVPDVHQEEYVWRYGIPSILKKGEKYAIITNGVMITRVLKARDLLIQKYDIHPIVINLSTLTDVNSEELIQLLSGVDLIVTLEDHSIYGGLGGIVTEILSSIKPTKILRLGLDRDFAECGPPSEIFRKYNMDENAVLQIFSEVIDS